MSMSLLDFSSEYGTYHCDRCGNKVMDYYDPDFGPTTMRCPNCETPGMRFSGGEEEEDE